MLLSTVRHPPIGKLSSRQRARTRLRFLACATTKPCTPILPLRHESTFSTTSAKSSTPIKPTGQESEPLRILFCGSDNFSCASLSALHALHKANPFLIESIDVLVRPGKPAGRGLKRVAVGPLFHLAESLSLPLHQRDTFTGWELPLPGRVTHPKTGVKTIFPHPISSLPHRPYSTFNLLIAVSFGLFVPPRILNSLLYGGLNIHPSLLPDLRGPAPVQWSILARRPCTGVTLQTLHPTEYDRGHIIAQTPPPGLVMPENATTPELLELLGREGATLLTEALQADLHVPPHRPTLGPETLKSHLFVPRSLATVLSPGGGDGSKGGVQVKGGIRAAPKITKADACIDWASTAWAANDEDLYPAGQWTARDLARRFRAVGFHPVTAGKVTGLWTHAHTVQAPREERLILEDVEAVPCPEVLREAVLRIVELKRARAQGTLSLSEGEKREELPQDVANILFSMVLDDSRGSKSFRVPVLVEQESVVIPIRVPYQLVEGQVQLVHRSGVDQYTAIRLRKIKNEGAVGKSAPKALARFMERDLTMQEAANLEYALDVMATQVAV